jgi:hypothetical protein
MIKQLFALGAVMVFAATSVFAGGKACCASGAKTTANHDGAKCVSFANLTLSAEQKSKLETWQADCMKAGCTKESHAKFLQQAKSILSADQYATLKKECGSGHSGKLS